MYLGTRYGQALWKCPNISCPKSGKSSHRASITAAIANAASGLFDTVSSPDTEFTAFNERLCQCFRLFFISTPIPWDRTSPWKVDSQLHVQHLFNIYITTPKIYYICVINFVLCLYIEGSAETPEIFQNGMSEPTGVHHCLAWFTIAADIDCSHSMLSHDLEMWTGYLVLLTLPHLTSFCVVIQKVPYTLQRQLHYMTLSKPQFKRQKTSHVIYCSVWCSVSETDSSSVRCMMENI
jgi:hypothetical protein